MKDKIQYCRKCGNLLKFKGSRIFWCRVCKKSFYYERIPEYKKDNTEKLNIIFLENLRSRALKSELNHGALQDENFS